MVEADGQTKIRKWGYGRAAKKLLEQVEWLNENAHRIPCAKVIHWDYGRDDFFYDMEYKPEAVNYFDFIHNNHYQVAENIFYDFFKKIDRYHNVSFRPASGFKRIAYVNEKILENLHKIKDYISIPKILFDQQWCIDQIQWHVESKIHGDLTIENVMIHGKEFFLIDPNPNNILDTPLLDWAKLMQSLHSGYEFMKIDGKYSKEYKRLHEILCFFIRSNYDKHVLKEVYFHEIVHFIRLIPYKIRKDPQNLARYEIILNHLVEEYLQ